MPPQNNNQMPPVLPTPPLSNQPSTPAFSIDSLQKDPKFMATMKTITIYGSIVYIISSIVGMFSTSLSYSYHFYNALSVGALITSVVYGVIFSAISGVLFYFLYGPIHTWVKSSTFLSKYIHDMFTLLWKPFFAITVLLSAYGLLSALGTIGVASAFGVSFGGLFTSIIITFVVNIVLQYFYYKMISNKLSSFYPW